VSLGRLTAFFFLATVFSVTFEKVHWELAGAVSLADVLALLFIGTFLAGRWLDGDGRVPRSAIAALLFALAFALVYLIGFFNLDTREALQQFAKGLVKFGIHFAFLAAGIAYLARRGLEFYWRTLGWLTAGLAVNALYGVAQLVAANRGQDLDQAVLAPVTGGASSINIYGAVEGADVYRPNALTGDPNHLAIMLLIPLLVLTPIYLRLEPGHRWRLRLAVLLPFLLVMQLATLSRSGVLGLAVGMLVLAGPYRRKFASRAFLIPLGVVLAFLLAIVARRADFFDVVIRSRFETSGASSSAHFDVYGFIPDVLSLHPLFGLGLNNFSVYYEFVTGRTNWGPHSFYVALLVETGLVGAALFGAFLFWIFRRLGSARRLGRALAAAGDPLAARLRPLAWGLTAALVGTMAANAFYLTMQFYYFYAFAVLALAVPIVFARADP
jgi:O-antigen ligase/polysaccharide polymerase Wzy-like membrane protein